MEPLFVESLSDLKANLRLSQASDEGDITSLLERAIRTVRVKFRKVLSQSRIEAILETIQASPLDPDEDNEYIREVAELAEIQWVWLELSYITPMMAIDSFAESREVFQEEGPFRRMDQSDLEAVRLRYQNEINDALDILGAVEDLDSNRNIRANAIGPDPAPVRIGKTWRRK